MGHFSNLRRTKMEQKIICGDCIKEMRKISDESINLSFSDIPFNINLSKRLKTRSKGFNGNSYKDDLSDDEYYNLINNWIKENYRVLKENGTLVIMTGWTNLNIILKSIENTNFTLLNHCIIKYAFGIYTKKRFTTSHYHLLFLTKSDKKWVFNKQTKYDEDVWLMNREFKSKELGHPCPTTYKWIEKIILTSSNEGDIILDSFSGTGTTLLVCEDNKRKGIGIDISEEYCNIAKQRIEDS